MLESFAEDVAIEEEQGVQCLVLCGCADSALIGQAGEVPGDFGLAHFGGMSLAVKEDVAADPGGVRAVGGSAVVLHADGPVDEVHEPDGAWGIPGSRTLPEGHCEALAQLSIAA